MKSWRWREKFRSEYGLFSLHQVDGLMDISLLVFVLVLRLKSDMQDGSANARKRMVDDLVETRQKYVNIRSKNQDKE